MKKSKKALVATRTENTIRNIIAGFISDVVSLLLGFIVRTILINRLGVDYVGIGSLFTSILQVLNVTELGFAAAIIFSMYEPVAHNNVKEIIAKLSLYKTVYTIVGCIVLCIGLSLLPFLNVLIKGDIPTNINIYVIYILYLLNTVLTYLTYGYKTSVLIAYQRNDIISNISSCTSILRAFLQIIVLLVFSNFYLYVIIITFITLGTNLLVNYFANKYHPELNVKMKFSLAGLKNISTQISGIAIGRISLVCRNSLDSIILSSMLGLTITAIYSNYYYIFSAVSTFLSIFLKSMSASVGNCLVTDSIEKNELDHRKFDFFYEIFVCFCVISLYCLYQPFMKLWIGEKFLLPSISMSLFCLYFFVNHLAQVRSVYSEASGLWWHFKYISISELVANLVLNIILGRYFGINGIIIATIITAFMSSFIGCTIITYRKLFHCSPKQYFLNNLYYFTISIIGCAIIGNILNCIDTSNWVIFGIKVIICGLLTLTYLFVAINIHSTFSKNLVEFKNLILKSFMLHQKKKKRF